MEGFYAVYYTGTSGFGHAVLVLNRGIVVGADAVGGIYEGAYSVTEDGSLRIGVTLTVPAGTTLVTGQTLPNPFSQTIEANLTSSFASGQTVPINTPMGPVNAVFKKIRGM